MKSKLCFPKSHMRFFDPARSWLSWRWSVLGLLIYGVHPAQAVVTVAALGGGAQDTSMMASTHSISPPSLDSNPLLSEVKSSAPKAITGILSPAQAQELVRLRFLALDKPPSALPKKNGESKVSAAEAAWTLGLLSLHGIGMPMNPAQAQEWFELAARKGFALAHAGLAWCAIEGCSAPSTPEAAQLSIGILHTVNSPRALYLEWLAMSRMAPIQLAPERNGTPRSQPEPTSAYTFLPHATLLLEAARKDDVQAHIELGIDNAANNRLSASLSHFQAAAARSTVAASNAKIIAERMSASPYPGQVLSRSSSDQDAAALLLQARRLHRGQGIPANFTEAIRLYRLAASMGDPQAEKMLRLIYGNLSPDGQINVAWMQQLKDIDLTTQAPQQLKPAAPFWLRREPTALYDLLPAMWR
jgi:TPR repeat protein